MKVSELIAALQHYPQELQVYFPHLEMLYAVPINQLSIVIEESVDDTTVCLTNHLQNNLVSFPFVLLDS